VTITLFKYSVVIFVSSILWCKIKYTFTYLLVLLDLLLLVVGVPKMLTM